MSYSAAAALLRSIELLQGVGVASIGEHAARLATLLVEQVASLGWTPYRPLGDPSASAHIVSLRHAAATVEVVQAALANEHRIVTSSRGGGIRVSLHAYNSEEDVTALARALASIGQT